MKYCWYKIFPLRLPKSPLLLPHTIQFKDARLYESMMSADSTDSRVQNLSGVNSTSLFSCLGMLDSSLESMMSSDTTDSRVQNLPGVHSASLPSCLRMLDAKVHGSWRHHGLQTKQISDSPCASYTETIFMQPFSIYPRGRMCSGIRPTDSAKQLKFYL